MYKENIMKMIFGVYTNGVGTNVEKTSYSFNGEKISSFKFSISPDDIEKVIRNDNELCAYTFDEKKIPTLRRRLREQKKKFLKTSMKG
jgi:hypothetical protein